MDMISRLYQIYLDCNKVCIDSRKLEDGDLFFAFKGEHTDGHKYVESVLSKPGTIAVIEDKAFLLGERTFLVPDTLEALQQLAKEHRKQFKGPVLGITGSNGKTTTKELIVAGLSAGLNVHATTGNYNNHIGVPLTVLSAPKDAEILVVEMGANKMGDISELCSIADPEYGLITNIGSAHIEGFGSIENIIKTKSELYDHIADRQGVLFVNKKDEILLNVVPDNTELILYPDDDLDLTNRDLFIEMRLKASDDVYCSALYGMYNAINIHAAFAVSEYFGIDRKQALNAIADYKPAMNRSQIIENSDTCFILDAYNANPSSMELSIKNLIYVERDKKILILGDMKELGPEEISWHASILELISGSEWERVILVGPLFTQAAQGMGYETYDSTADLISAYKAKTDAFKDSICLLKASRSIGLEKFVEIF